LLSLSLFMFWILTNYPQDAFSFNDFALFADFLYR
jgi:hypothetical protein